MNNNNVDNYDGEHWTNTTQSDPAMQVDTNSVTVSVVSDSVLADPSTSSAKEPRKSNIIPVNQDLFNMTRNLLEGLPLIFRKLDIITQQNEIIAESLKLEGNDKRAMDGLIGENRTAQEDVTKFLSERYSITASQVKAWPNDKKNSGAGNRKGASNGGRGGYRGGMRGRGRGGARGGSTRGQGRGGAAQK